MCLPQAGQKLSALGGGGVGDLGKQLATWGKEAAVAAKNAELSFLMSSLCWEISEWYGFGKMGVGFLDYVGAS